MMHNNQLTHLEGQVPDPFSTLHQLAGEQGARLSMTVQRAEDYGQTKCSCTITISCPQTAQQLDAAAALAFDAGLRYVNWGMQYLAPHLQSVPGPSNYAGHGHPKV